MTLEEFGQTVKTKYPQYSGMSDFQVGQKMLAKYPAYQNKITEEKQKPDYLQKASNIITSIFPGEKFGEAIGTQIAKARAKPEEKQFISPGPTKKELIGETLRTGAFLASVGLPGGGGVATKALQFGGLGAVSAGGTALTEDKTIKESAKNALIGGLTGATLGGIIGGAQKGIKAIVAKTPEQLYNNALRVSQRIDQAGKSPSKFLIENKIWGDLGSIQRQSQIGIDVMNKNINDKLINSTGIIKGENIYNEASKIIKNKFGNILSSKEISDILRKVQATGLKKGQNLSLFEANKIRQQVDSVLGDRFYLAQQSPIQKETAGAISNVLRKNIQSISGTGKEFNRLSNFIRTHKLTERAIALSDKKYGLGMIDILAGSGGLTIGGPIGGITAIAGKKILGSPTFQTGAAQTITKLGKVKAPIIGQVGKAITTRLIGEIGK